MIVCIHDTAYSLTCRFVTSYPYSLSRTSGWHGYRVCDIRIIVSGPHKHLPEVQSTLGKLKNFTCTTCSRVLTLTKPTTLIMNLTMMAALKVTIMSRQTLNMTIVLV